MSTRLSLSSYDNVQLVQTRVVAQASTLGTLIASGMLAGMGSQGEKPKKAEDHSWRDILGESGRTSRIDFEVRIPAC